MLAQPCLLCFCHSNFLSSHLNSVPLKHVVCVQVLQDQFGSSIHTALIIKPDNFWQKQRTNLGSQKYKFEVNILEKNRIIFFYPPSLMNLFNT
jgi:hypothetical protein